MAQRGAPIPCAAIIDWQSAKTAAKAAFRGYAAAKKVTGRKRHIVVDPLGLIIAVIVHAARHRRGFTRLVRIRADSGYAGALMEWVTIHLHGTLEIAKHRDKQSPFVVPPKRRIVERTPGRQNRIDA
jgi:putative transposase